MGNHEVNEDILMLFEKMPDALPLYLAVEEWIFGLFPKAERKVGRTQVSFSNRYGFAFVWPPNRRVKDRPDNCVMLTFGLGSQVVHPRIIQAVEPYPGRWTHHMVIASAGELDGQVRDWLQQAWAFSMRK